MTEETKNIPKVVFAGFASCFGCQINITNIEQYLLDVLGQIDMQYWQLTSSDPMPEDFDICVIEGAITTEEALKSAKALREKADTVITIGSCAKTAGIPGMASLDFEPRPAEVYRNGIPEVVSDAAFEPRSVKDAIAVDFEVPCCPVDPYRFVEVLQKALNGSNAYERTSTLCGECKQNERGCFYGRGVLCLGMVTQSGCHAKCPNLGRPCNGCAGLSEDANLEAARRIASKSGIDEEAFDIAITMFNQTDPRIMAAEEEGALTAPEA